MNETRKNNLQKYNRIAFADAPHAYPPANEHPTCTASFAVKNWAAWHTTLTSQNAWLEWAQRPTLPMGAEIPELKNHSSPIRRRTHRLGKLALHVLNELPRNQTPIIFCSRFGELDRSFNLLKELTESGQVSPQGFSLAVHNAIPSLFTIEQSSHVNLIALAAQGSAFAGIIEALGLFTQGESMVRLVYCEDTIPACYTPFINQSELAYAFALDLVPGSDFNLRFETKSHLTSLAMLPLDLAMFHFLISNQVEFSVQVGHTHWYIQKCGN